LGQEAHLARPLEQQGRKIHHGRPLFGLLHARPGVQQPDGDLTRAA
jgi:hypothetical protein